MTRHCLRTPQFLLLIAMPVVAFAGCTSQDSKCNLEGSVTVDGQPLKSGLIRFLPIDGQSATADATISDGSFRAILPPGDKRVEITAPKVVGRRKAYDTPDSPVVDIIEELLPARYNARSELTITADVGNQRANFDLRRTK
jgi:hypothetical protein